MRSALRAPHDRRFREEVGPDGLGRALRKLTADFREPRNATIRPNKRPLLLFTGFHSLALQEKYQRAIAATCSHEGCGLAAHLFPVSSPVDRYAFRSKPIKTKILTASLPSELAAT